MARHYEGYGGGLQCGRVQQSGEAVQIPQPLAERNHRGEFRVRIPSEIHRVLATRAAEQRDSLNRLRLRSWR